MQISFAEPGIIIALKVRACNIAGTAHHAGHKVLVSTCSGATLPLEGGRIKHGHRRGVNRLLVGVHPSYEIGTSIVLDKGVARSWLWLIVRGGHGGLRGGGEGDTDRVTDTSLCRHNNLHVQAEATEKTQTSPHNCLGEMYFH